MANTVQIQMKDGAGVIGEDRTDWLGGETHECSPQFARHLVLRGLAHIVETSAPRAATIEHGDPAIETRDPEPAGLDTESGGAIAKRVAKRPRA